MKRTFGLFVLTAALLQGATGCIYSADREVIKSTYLSPKTVTVVYQPSNETAWTYDIPPGHMLVVERDGESGNFEWYRNDQLNPQKLMWELYPLDATPSFTRKDHYLSKPVEAGEMMLEGSRVVVAWTQGPPIDANTASRDRTIEEIEQDLPEPTEDALPEPDTETEAEPELDLPEPDAPADQ